MVIWEPSGNYRNVLRTFCSMRDRNLLNIRSVDYPTTAYELEIKCDRHTFVNAFRIHSVDRG